MKSLDRILLRTACVVVLLAGVFLAMQVYASQYNARTHDTIAQRRASNDCIVAGGSVDACNARFDPPHRECEIAFSGACFATIFAAEPD